MKLSKPDAREAAAMVAAMQAVASAGGRMPLLPLEEACIAAMQRHMLGLPAPLEGIAAGPLPPDLAAALPDPEMRRGLVRLLAILPVVDRRILPEKVALVEQAAAALGVQEYGIELLRHASRGKMWRVALGLMSRFVGMWWSPTGKARLRDYGAFLWWMLPQLHDRKTAERNRAMVERYRGLAALPDGTLGRELLRFFESNRIPLPGERASVPWVMHEVYHVVSEYGVTLRAELALTAFIGGSQEETCLDQILFGLMAYHAGRPIISGFVAQGVLEPEPYFSAMARGAAMRRDLMRGWDLWADAPRPLSEIRRDYGIPDFAPEERRFLAGRDDLVEEGGRGLPQLAAA